MLWMKRFIYSFVGLLVLLAVLVLVLRWWILGTESGTRFALRQLPAAELDIGTQRGTLGSGLTLGNLRYQTAGVLADIQQVQLTIDLDLLPWPSLYIRRLHISDVAVQLSESGDQPATGRSKNIPELASPIAIQLENLWIERLSVISEGQAQPVQIDSLQARLSYYEVLDLQQLMVNSGGFSANTSGTVELKQPFQHGLTVSLSHQDTERLPELRGLSADLHSRGSLQQLNLRAETSGPIAVGLEGSVQNLPDEPVWQLSLQNLQNDISWPPQGSTASLVIDSFQLTSDGSFDDHQSELNASISYPEVIQGRWEVALAGDTDQLIVERLSGPILQGRVTGSGEYALSSEIANAEVRLQLQDIKPDIEQPELADLPGISGTVQASLSDTLLSLDQFNLRVPETDWRISGNADYILDDRQLDMSVNWQQLSWPPQSGSSAQYISRQGQLQASGILEDMTVNLNTDIDGEAVPGASIMLNGHLADNVFSLRELLMQTLDGQLNIDGEVDWTAGLRWNIDISAEQINPGMHWPDFPGAINLQADSQGTQSAEQIDAVLNIQKLNGTLREQPVSGSGQVKYLNGSIQTDGLQLQSGDAQLNLQGNEQALQAQIDIPRLEALLPGAAGSMLVNINGESADDGVMTLNNMLLKTNLDAEELSWSGLRAQTLSLDGNISSDVSNLLAELSLVVSNLRIPDQAPVSSINVELTADDDQQQLQLQAIHPDASLDLLMAGQWDQWPLPNFWNGHVRHLTVENELAGQWSLGQQAALNVDADSVVLQPLCLQGPADQSSQNPGICIEYQRQVSSQVAVDLQDLPLSMAEAWLSTGLRSNHLLSGKLLAGWQDRITQLEGDMRLSPGEIHFLDSNSPPLQVNGGNLSLSLNNNQQLSTRMQLTIEDTNAIETDMLIGPLNSDQRELDGTVKLSMPNLEWLQKPVPGLDRIAGELEMLATFSGPLRQPLIAMDINLQDGEVDYQPLGMQLNNLQLTGNSMPGEVLQLNGGFSAGDGNAVLSGSLVPNTRTAQLSIAGEELQIFNSEAIKVRLSPELQLAASPQGYQINGELRIPEARIKPPRGSASRVTESEDVVLVGVTEQHQVEAESVPIAGQLKVVFGEEVAIDADILETHLAGVLDLTWDNQVVPLVNGEIALQDGRVQFFGQNLTLENSRVVYNDAPADNPRLDIRAARRIFADPQVEEAGVAVSGVAQQPVIRVYTSPATNEESALAYIATGSNFDHANGQGALNLGVYLFPKLFVSYGLGLFDNGNTANARYEFSENWNVSLQSGSRDTGVDLNWRKDG